MMSEEEVKKLLEDLQKQFNLWQEVTRSEAEKVKSSTNIDELDSYFKNMLNGLLLLDRVIQVQKIMNHYDSNNLKILEEYRNILIELFKMGYKRK